MNPLARRIAMTSAGVRGGYFLGIDQNPILKTLLEGLEVAEFAGEKGFEDMDQEELIEFHPPPRACSTWNKVFLPS